MYDEMDDFAFNVFEIWNICVFLWRYDDFEWHGVHL